MKQTETVLIHITTQATAKHGYSTYFSCHTNLIAIKTCHSVSQVTR